MDPQLVDLMSRVQSGETTCIRAAEIIEAREETNIEIAVSRFLQWRLPQSACPDRCVFDNTQERFGTNILSAAEARQMILHIMDR